MTLAAKLMLRQQEQTVSGRFGSWHQDGARRCEDLYVRVVGPEIARTMLRYGRHDADCETCHDSMHKPRPVCTCGFDQAIALGAP